MDFIDFNDALNLGDFKKLNKSSMKNKNDLNTEIGLEKAIDDFWNDIDKRSMTKDEKKIQFTMERTSPELFSLMMQIYGT